MKRTVILLAAVVAVACTAAACGGGPTQPDAMACLKAATRVVEGDGMDPHEGHGGDGLAVMGAPGEAQLEGWYHARDGLAVGRMVHRARVQLDGVEVRGPDPMDGSDPTTRLSGTTRGDAPCEIDVLYGPEGTDPGATGRPSPTLYPDGIWVRVRSDLEAPA